VRLVEKLLALAGATPKHLLEENARLYLPQEDDGLQIRDVDAGRHEVDRNDDACLRTVAKFADPLERPIHAAGDLPDERLSAAEDVDGDVYQLVRV